MPITVEELIDFEEVSYGMTYPPARYYGNEMQIQNVIFKNVKMGNPVSAKKELENIFRSINKARHYLTDLYRGSPQGGGDPRVAAERNEFDQITWPSIATDIATWWSKYVDEAEGNARIAQIERDYDPQNFAMAESLLRHYVKNIITS